MTLGRKQTRVFTSPRVRNYNEARVVVEITPAREADQARDHDLIVSRAEIPALITALQRALDYKFPNKFRQLADYEEEKS